MQLEKLRALKPVGDILGENQGPQRKPGLTSTKIDPKALGKEIQEEVACFLCSPARSLPRTSSLPLPPAAFCPCRMRDSSVRSCPPATNAAVSKARR
jgi:hypothetical protein